MSQNINELIRAFQKNPSYWIVTTVVLLFMIRLFGSFLFNTLFTFIIISGLLHIGFNDFRKAAIYTVIIMIIMSLINYFGPNASAEGFDNLNEKANSLGSGLDEALKQLESLSKMTHKTDGENLPKDTVLKGDKKDEKQVGGAPVVTVNGKTQPVEEFNQWSTEEQGKVFKGLVNKNTKRPAATAQRELFQLIDTVKQLQDTVEQLAPTLKEGKKIMDAFENIKMN
jgi:hypothetical protein